MKRDSVYYHLCPRCFRATPSAAGERYCPNDGSELLSECPHCGTPITSPYHRFCSSCGQEFSPAEGLEEMKNSPMS